MPDALTVQLPSNSLLNIPLETVQVDSDGDRPSDVYQRIAENLPRHGPMHRIEIDFWHHNIPYCCYFQHDESYEKLLMV